METVRKYLQWLANIIPQAKSVLIMKQIVFDEGEKAVMRAMIYFLQIFFIGIVLISIVDYFVQLAGIESDFLKNIIFVVLFSLYAGTSILDIMLRIDEMRKEFTEKEKKFERALEEANNRADGLEELLISCRYNSIVCEKRLKKFQLYFERIEPIFADIQRSKSKAIAKSAVLMRYKQAKESFDRVPTEFMSFEEFRVLYKKS
ncbi:hypothetical protein [Persephonella sp.]